MTQADVSAVAGLNEAVEMLLAGQPPPRLDAARCDDEGLSRLHASIDRLLRAFNESNEFIASLSKGNLDADPPARNFLVSRFKQLHANLRHLTWQTQQIAKGDLSQRVTFLGEFSAAFNAMIESLREKRLVEEELERQATTDTLTGIYNRLKFSEVLSAEIGRAERYGAPLSLVMLDIDHFKEVNDAYGHQAGDSVLRELARLISANIRNYDSFARWGGEEFMLLAPNDSLENAAALAGKLRAIVQESAFEGAGRVTCSFGVAAYRAGDTLESFTGRADEALYKAKSGGRNRVEAESGVVS